MRVWLRPHRWLSMIVTVLFVYIILFFFSQLPPLRRLSQWPEGTSLRRSKDVDYAEDELGIRNAMDSNDGREEERTPSRVSTSTEQAVIHRTPDFVYNLTSKQYGSILITDVLTRSSIPFRDRMTANVRESERRRVILSYDAGHSPVNLGGCPDWRCDFTTDRNRAEEADVVLIMSPILYTRKRPDQYIAFFSQESPRNMGVSRPQADYFNLSLGYRHDTAGASPYGYTVRLAEERPRTEVVNMARLKGKTKGAAWFVSHCMTNSRRERLVDEMKKHVAVDIYGHCWGGLSCPKGGACENGLDDDYHFYLAFENSICTDYITEKVWNQGYGRDIVPIVLKRSIAEDLLPPRSFLAVDDYQTVTELTDRMNYLMRNKTAYSEYFEWRTRFQTIFLNGREHDALERPWGFCQLCRLAWTRPQEEHAIPDFKKWWDGSCEDDGQTVNRLIDRSTPTTQTTVAPLLRANRVPKA